MMELFRKIFITYHQRVSNTPFDPADHSSIMEYKKQSPEVFCKKAFVEILQNSQENTCASVPAALLKKRFWHRFFSMNFAKFLRTPFFIEHLWWLLLEYLLSLDFFIHFTSVLKQSP